MGDLEIANSIDNRLEENHLKTLRFILSQGRELVESYSWSGKKRYFNYVQELDYWRYLKNIGTVERDHRDYAVLVVSKKGNKILEYIENQRTLMEQQNPVIALA